MPNRKWSIMQAKDKEEKQAETDGDSSTLKLSKPKMQEIRPVNHGEEECYCYH